MRTLPRIVITMLVALATLMAAIPAVARELSFTFVGTVTEVDGYDVGVGSDFTAVLIFDSDQTDGNPSPAFGHYYAKSLSVQFASNDVCHTGISTIIVFNDAPAGDGFAAMRPGSHPCSSDNVLIIGTEGLSCWGDSSLYADDSLPGQLSFQEFPDGCSLGRNYSCMFSSGRLHAEVTSIYGTDSDLDGRADHDDNCIAHNNPDQRDTDGDGLGNECDPDLNNDCSVNFGDLELMNLVFFSNDENADLNGDGQVDFLDLGIMRQEFFRDYTADNPSGMLNICDGN